MPLDQGKHLRAAKNLSNISPRLYPLFSITSREFNGLCERLTQIKMGAPILIDAKFNISMNYFIVLDKGKTVTLKSTYKN